MSVMGQLRAAREYMYPARTTSAFLSKGVLTPEEFVLAGDELVYRCPTWSWSAGNPAQAKPHLPPDKQFLITRNVPCQTRVSEMENMVATEGGEGDDDDWMVSRVVQQQDEGNIEDEFDILDDDGEVVTPPAKEDVAIEEEEDEYADMVGFEDNNIIEDEAAAEVAPGDDDGGNFVKVRTYDLSITYDKYYQTPRVWMMGYTANTSQPLTGTEMMEDVISDYANRTVTIENHPHVAGPHASIHPCQHGKVMKTIVKNLIKSSQGVEEEGPDVNMYLFIFLKFVSSIIPTINYDFTMSTTADTAK